MYMAFQRTALAAHTSVSSLNIREILFEDDDHLHLFSSGDGFFAPTSLLQEVFSYIAQHSPTTNPIPHLAVAMLEAPLPPGAPGPARRIYLKVDEEKRAPEGEAILPAWCLSVLGVPPGTEVTLSCLLYTSPSPRD